MLKVTHLTLIVVKNSKRPISTATGFDTATISVKVLHYPDPPENLHADEFAGDALTLFWNPPKDNGGSPITGYVVERKLIDEDKWTKATHVHVVELTYK